MFLDILRHGIAEDARAGMSDTRRVLTDEGREKLRRVLSQARLAGVSPSLILSSPLIRAVQTAEIAAEVLRYEGRIVQTRALQPESSPAAFWEEVRSRGGESDIVVAGHQPMLGQLVAFLLGCPALQVDMKKAALVRIELASVSAVPRGVLQWMLIPKLAADK
jgi:phosphohistidine phosphatase